MLKPKK
jgi:hypothetical protein